MKRIKKVWIIIGACLTGALCLGGGIGIGWVIHKQDENKVTDPDNLPGWVKNREWRCDAQFYVDAGAKSGKYDMWFSDEIENKDLCNPLVLFTFPNSKGLEPRSDLEFRLTNFGTGFQKIEKNQLNSFAGDYMGFGIMTPRGYSPYQDSIKETITWIDDTPGSEKGIKQIDIHFFCTKTYTNDQIGLAESEFDFV